MPAGPNRERCSPREAFTTEEHLPPVGWADVATKRDLDHLELGIRAEIAVLRSEMGVLRSDVRAELHSTLRGHLLALIAADAAMFAAVVAAVKL